MDTQAIVYSTEISFKVTTWGKITVKYKYKLDFSSGKMYE
jgi:hypothetical protein